MERPLYPVTKVATSSGQGPRRHGGGGHQYQDMGRGRAHGIQRCCRPTGAAPTKIAGAEEELVVKEHREPAPPSPPATCESCPWHTMNPWTHDPALGAWCHRRMEPLATGNPACEEFRRGEVPPRQPYEQGPAVPSVTSPAPQEHVTCADCPHFEAYPGPNPRQAWGKSRKRGRGRFGCATACRVMGEAPPCGD